MDVEPALRPNGDSALRILRIGYPFDEETLAPVHLAPSLRLLDMEISQHFASAERIPLKQC